MVYIIKKTIPMFSRKDSVSKSKRNLRKDVKVEVFPYLNANIPSWLVKYSQFWYCHYCFNLESEPDNQGYIKLCSSCRKRMKLCTLRWSSKIRVYHTRYIINKKTGETYSRRNGRKMCTPIKRIYDGKLFLFYDVIVSKLKQWETKKKSSK